MPVEELALSGALAGLVISSLMGILVAALNLPACSKAMLRLYKLTGAPKRVQTEFLDGIRRFLTMFGCITAVASAALYVALEIVRSGGHLGETAAILVIATLLATAMVFTRARFVKKHVLGFEIVSPPRKKPAFRR